MSNPAVTDSILFGHNNEERIISVNQTGDSSVEIVKDSEGKREIVSRRFYPFFFLSDISLLKSYDKKYWNVPLSGSGFYKHLCIFRKWSDMRAALRTILQNYNKLAPIPADDVSEIDAVYIKQDPVHQFLTQTGMTLFKNMEFSELRRMQLDIETYSRHGFSSSHRPEDRIILISLSDNSGWTYVINGQNKGEDEMLRELVELIRSRDPDVIEGHNIFNFDLPYLMRRCEMHGIKFEVGRGGATPRASPGRISFAEREIEYSNIEIPGRHVIDTWLLVQSYDMSKRDLESYGLKYVAKYFGLANENRVYIPGSEISKVWDQDPEKLIAYALDDVRETRLLAEHLSQTNFYLAQMLPFNYGQIGRIGSAAKIEALLVREYLRRKHSLPKPQIGKQTTGGYTDVFWRGVLGPIVHSDVESLYPSIMLSYGIQPSTDSLGAFQRLLKHLTRLRIETKKKMKLENDPILKSKLDAFQSSLKILINSFYGYLGYPRGIFNDFQSADKVTQSGQKILKQMIDSIAAEGGIVVEVDTDGIYFVPPEGWRGETKEKEFVERISNQLPSGINLTLDGRYEKMLSYKKKNYALLGYDGKIKIKGSALISRSIEKFGREFINSCIEMLLREDIEGIHKLFLEYSDSISSRQMPLEKMLRTETLKESIEQYTASVNSSKRNRSASYESVISAGLQYRPGDKVSFYITGSDANPRTFSNARIYDERSAQKKDYNINYYLKKLYEYAQRFLPFFEYGDFQNIFSDEKDSLFKPDLSSVKIKTAPLQETTAEDEEAE
ncbi:MAG: DNA polymerase domain-containing protein [Candidatus Kryptoniota bacterium]